MGKRRSLVSPTTPQRKTTYQTLIDQVVDHCTARDHCSDQSALTVGEGVNVSLVIGDDEVIEDGATLHLPKIETNETEISSNT